MLLVDDGKPEGPVLHRLLYQCVRAHHELEAAVGKPLHNRPALFFGGAAGQQGATHAGGRKILLNIGIMLPGKHFSRRHNAGLIPVPYGDKTAQNRHHRLPGAHVSLQQTVHLGAAGHIGPNLLYHPLLGTRKCVWQSVVASVERRAYVRHHYAVCGLAAHVFLLEQAELKIEQLLELESAGGGRQRAHIGREMYVLNGPGQGRQTIFAQNVIRQALLHLVQA